MTGTTKPRRHYNTETGQMLWLPRRLYAFLRRLAAVERRPVSRQLELIITEWVQATLARVEGAPPPPSVGEAERMAALREVAEWPKAPR